MMKKDEWVAAQGRLVKAWTHGDTATAFAEIARVVADGEDAMKAQALFYSGMIHEDSDIEAAIRDWMAALASAPEGSHTRHLVEQKLGEAGERVGRREQAMSWYRSAMKTCADGGEFAGGIALKSFLAVAGSRLSSEDKRLASDVATKSWRILGLSGEPDLADLPRVADLMAPRSEPEDDH